MKSITLNRYWQGMGTPMYPPGVYDESTMSVERMTYLVQNGHADWRPDSDTPSGIRNPAERAILQKIADGDQSEWTSPPSDGQSFKQARAAQQEDAKTRLRAMDVGADGNGDHDGEDAETDDPPPDAGSASDDADYQTMTKGQLFNIAAAGGLELSDRLSKQAIIDALIAHGKE
jgi:hypothetical protein